VKVAHDRFKWRQLLETAMPIKGVPPDYDDNYDDDEKEDTDSGIARL